MNTLINRTKTLKSKIEKHISYIGLDKVCNTYNNISYKWTNGDDVLVLYNENKEEIAKLLYYNETVLFLSGLITGFTYSLAE